MPQAKKATGIQKSSLPSKAKLESRKKTATKFFYFAFLFSIFSYWDYYWFAVNTPPIIFQMMQIASLSYILVLPIVFIALFKRNKEISLVFIATLVFSYILSSFLKNMFKVERPCRVYQLFPSCEKDYSFPSSHALVLSVVFPFLKKNEKKYYFLWFLLVLASRITLGAHYPEDLIFGSVVGVGLGYFVIFFHKSIHKFAERL